MSKKFDNTAGTKTQIGGGNSRFGNERQDDYTALIHAAERRTRRRHKRSDQIISAFKKSIQGRMFRKVSFVMAGIVVFATTYSLILPALTLDYDTLSDLPGLHLGQKPVVVEVLNSENSGRDDGDFLSLNTSSAVASDEESSGVDESANTDGAVTTADQSVNDATEVGQANDKVDTHKELLWVDKDADEDEIEQAVKDTFGDQVKSEKAQPANDQSSEENPLQDQSASADQWERDRRNRRRAS